MRIHPSYWYLQLLFLALAFPFIARAQETYTSPVFQVTLQHPAGWRHVEGYEEKYDGADGFFQLSALSGEGKTIEEICEWEAANFAYGFLPQLQWWQVQGQDACVIWPSEDQELVKRDQAALIVRFPKPVQIRGNVCHYLILWADKYHIVEMAKTLDFVEPPDSTYTGPDLRQPKWLILKLRGTDEATKPVFNPETHALKYIDRQLCFAVDVPADWTSDGILGAFAWFGFREQEQLSFNISTDNLVAPILEQALASVRRGSLGPYIQEVRDFTLSNQSALWVTFTPAPVADAFRFVVLVIAPDCGDRPHSLFIGAKPGAEREQFETFLSHLHFLRSGS